MKKLILLFITNILINNSILKSYNILDLKKLQSGENHLVEADFSNLDLSDQDFSRKTLTRANFSNTTLNRTNFSNSKLTGANFSNCKSAQSANFIGSMINNSNCNNANFSGAIFGNRKIHNWNCATLNKANLKGANFRRAILDKVDLLDVTIDENTDFSEASMFLVNVNRQIFEIVKYENTELIEKPDDRILEELITEFRELKLEQLRIKQTPQDPEKLYIPEECPICLCKLEPDKEHAILPCGHVFHIDCIKEWLPRSLKCPLCNFVTNKYKIIKLEK